MQNPTAVDDGGSAAPAAAAPTSDAAATPAPVVSQPGVTCGSAQCSGSSSDICCINWSGGGATSQVCKKSDECEGARLACDEPSDCPGAVCCLSNALFGQGDPPRTKCDSKCDGSKDSRVCDPAVGCATGTCTKHPVIGLYYCR